MILKKSRLIVLALIAGITGSARGVEVWYDMEGDYGRVLTDKLTGDGSQNASLLNRTLVQMIPGTTGYGDQNVSVSADWSGPPYSTIEVPDSTMLGAQYTLAMWVDCTESDNTRLFSSYAGGGSITADRILVDINETGDSITGIRAFVNGTATGTAAPPAGMADPGYHHYAMTVDNGNVAVYLDGTVVASGNVGTGYSNSLNLRLGEDPHEIGTPCEQLAGSVDEFLAINQVLSAADIASLASGSTIDQVVTPTGEYAVYYDFENGVAADKFTADGAQDGILYEDVKVISDAAAAQVGSGSAFFGPKFSATDPNAVNLIDTGVSGTELGDAFTLSVCFNAHELGQTAEGLTRLFSNYAGSSSAAGRIILDLDQRETSAYGFGIRFLLPDGTAVKATEIIPLNEDHTVTAVYDNGLATVYLDGMPVATATGTGTLSYDDVAILLGEDIAGGKNEQFVGEMDDVVILSRALSASEVATLASEGAAALFGGTGEIPGDLNNDGMVGSADLDIVRGAWGQSVDPGCLSCGDPSGDGTVGSADLDIVRANWGRTAAAAVPEPHLIALLAAGIALLFAQRRNK